MPDDGSEVGQLAESMNTLLAAVETQFAARVESENRMRQFLAEHPEEVESQRKGRATWWDKPQDLETMQEHAESDVPQPSYVYFPLPVLDDSKADESGNKASTPSRPA